VRDGNGVHELGDDTDMLRPHISPDIGTASEFDWPPGLPTTLDEEANQHRPAIAAAAA
jgi:hypothetical protein